MNEGLGELKCRRHFVLIVWIASNQEKVQGVYEKFIILLGGRYFSSLR